MWEKLMFTWAKKIENGPAVITLYQTTTSLPSEICCKSADSEYERTKLFFNGTVFTQAFEFGPLADSRNITDLVNLFNNGSAYVQVYTYHPDSLSLFGIDGEIRGQCKAVTCSSFHSNKFFIPKIRQEDL